MKRKFFAFIALITATLSLSSCLSSDETTVEYTHDTAITAFSLGNHLKVVRYRVTNNTGMARNIAESDFWQSGIRGVLFGEASRQLMAGGDRKSVV